MDRLIAIVGNKSGIVLAGSQEAGSTLLSSKVTRQLTKQAIEVHPCADAGFSQ